MRLNPHSPSDNPMEQLFYCFGGDDDNGGGGSQDSQMDELDQISADFENMSQQQAAGETVTSGMSGGVGRGGSSNDNDGDGIPNSIDRTPGVDRSGFGGGDAFDQSRSYVDQAITDFARGPAGGAGANIGDTDPFSDFGNIDQLTSFGYGPGIQSTDVPSQAEVSAAIAAGVPAVQAQTTGFTAPSVGAGLTGRVPGDMGGDTSIERDVFGTGEDEYSTQSIFDVDPTGLGLETPQERIARQKAENTRAAARTAAAERAKTASEQAQREALQRSLGISERDIALQTQLDEAMAPERARQAEEDALAAQLGAEADANRAARESRTTDRGIESLMGGTVFGAPDVTGQAEDIGNNRSAAAPGINVNIGPVESQADVNRAADEALAAAGLSTPTERTVNGVPVTDTAERAVIDIENYQSIDDRTEEESKAALAEAEANLEAARAEAYRNKQFGFDTGLPESIDVFGFQAPTGIGIAERVADALFDSEATLANAIAEYGIKSVDDEEAKRAANYNPQGLEVVTSGGPVTEGGRTVAYDARGNIVYDSRGIGGQIGDLLTGNRPPENIQALYDKQRAIDDAERERNGDNDGGGQPIIPPIEDFIGEAQTPERDQFELGEYQYDPMAPVQYSYTGLPTLAPFVLRPSRTSNRDFIRPTYAFGGLGSLRRS